VAKSDLEVKIVGSEAHRSLQVSGHRSVKDEDGESEQVKFTRSISLSRDADCKNISATHADGVLTITIPRLTPEESVVQIQ
jgi:HSP20 family molecular chaperone IbpA